MTLATDPPAHLRIRLYKAGADGGWRVQPNSTAHTALDNPPWMTLRAEQAPSAIALALPHPAGAGGIALRADPAILTALLSEGVGETRDDIILLPDFTAATTACRRAWYLARSLPTAPADALSAALSREGIGWSGPTSQDLDPTRTTTREAMVRVRVGQATFRAALLEYWEGCCPLTGIADHALLRASHITPWSECRSDAERLDAFNGLLLSALWDAAFDAFLVSFDETGQAVASPALVPRTAEILGLEAAPAIPLAARHKSPLARHRARTLANTATA